MKTVIKNRVLKIGNEPMVILLLKKWQKMEEMLDEVEDFVKFNQAISDPENQKQISFKEFKKKFNLP